MINFNEEIKRFQPNLEVNQVEEEIFKNDLQDMTDVIEKILAKDTGHYGQTTIQ